MDFFLFAQKTPKPQKSQELQTSTPQINTVKNFKNGQMVRIIYKENSSLNYYKGYLGEIRHYKRGSPSVKIILHAPLYARCMLFPIDHFITI